MGKPISPAEFTRKYVPDVSKSAPARLADFLKEGAKTLPGRYFTKAQCAKVAHCLTRLPPEDNLQVRRLGNVIASARKILSEEGKFIQVDRVEGVRGTTDMDDAVETEYRKKRSRMEHAIGNFIDTDSLIDLKQVRNSALQAEVRSTRKATKQITAGVVALPQLPPVGGTRNNKE